MVTFYYYCCSSVSGHFRPVSKELNEILFFIMGQRDRLRWPARNANNLGTSHIPNHQCRFQILRHQEETHIPCCHNGRHRLSPFELWSMERLWDLRRSFLEKEMYMVAHKTIGIDMTSGLKGLTLCVNIRLRLPTYEGRWGNICSPHRPQTPAVCSRHEVWRDKR